MSYRLCSVVREVERRLLYSVRNNTLSHSVRAIILLILIPDEIPLKFSYILSNSGLITMPNKLPSRYP